jgi:hypothetical protein
MCTTIIREFSLLGTATPLLRYRPSHAPLVGATPEELLSYTLNLKILRMTYFAYFHSVVNYDIIFGGSSA